jgi:hypothetical protein
VNTDAPTAPATDPGLATSAPTDGPTETPSPTPTPVETVTVTAVPTDPGSLGQLHQDFQVYGSAFVVFAILVLVVAGMAVVRGVRR